jgi:pimeloyl-ACP methyl ester carboxylesterase
MFTAKLAALAGAAILLGVAPEAQAGPPQSGVRVWTITYTAHSGVDRLATVVLPSGYGSGANPPLPVVISPHGRGATGRSNAKFWGALPAVGRFAVISPDGMGERLDNFSYGSPGQIDDLAKMPDFAEKALPWLRIDRSRVYALGSSMGGQETLLLVARHPQLLAGAAAMDSVTDLARRYRQLPAVPCDARCLQRWGKPYGEVLQSTMSREVGGTPEQTPAAYDERSGLSRAAEIASSGVPLQIWWSHEDRIVSDQEHQSAALFDELRRLDRCAPVEAFAGRWAHSKEMRASALLPIALIRFNLLPHGFKSLPASVRHEAVPLCADRNGVAAAGLRLLLTTRATRALRFLERVTLRLDLPGTR